MHKTYSLLSIFVAVLGLSLTGCRDNNKSPAAASGPARPGCYFQTAWQDESQFIVTAIVTDIAEMACYARNKSLPNPKQFSVSVVEKPGSPFGAPVYDVDVALDGTVPALKQELKLNGSIWSPDSYADIVARLFEAVGLTEKDLVTPGAPEDQFLSELANLTARQIAQLDVSISEALASRFRDPALHEKAALLLGAFMLRENSGDFFEIRSPLCRMTAHLAMARKFAGQRAPNLNAQLAGALLLTLLNNQTAALEKLGSLKNAPPGAQPWIRALRTRNTDDYRILANSANLTQLERLELFRASCSSVSPDLAWRKLDDAEKARTSDYARVVNAAGAGVESGHQLLAVSISAELAEFSQTYSILRKKALKQSDLSQVLNEMPERCFTPGPAPEVRVIGWGQWAMFHQRHLCHAMQKNFEFMQHMWGVPDEAKKFSRRLDKTFSELRLYPFVRRFNATEQKDYHRAVDDAYQVTIHTPHLVSAQIWNNLCYKVAQGDFPLYNPGNPHINEWHKHNPPPGTAYDPLPRMNHRSLIERTNAVACLERLHEVAPYDEDIAFNLLRLKYKGQPTFEQMEAVYRPLLDYNDGLLVCVARKAKDQPAHYEKLMLKAAQMNPARYYELGSYLSSHGDEGKAARYLEKAMLLFPDEVTAASYSGWLIKYYERNMMIPQARALADRAGETYSYLGLEAKGEFLEFMGKHEEAIEYGRKIKERYGHSDALLGFLTRYKATTGSTRHDSELNAELKKLFPGGIKKVTLSQLQGRPDSGVIIKEDNQLLQAAGLQSGDLIVALYGIRVHNFEQYGYARASTVDPQMDLLIWRKNQYLQVKASPPDHRFNADFATWPR